ncbi:MAG: hypothetical protein NZM05_12645, partial [Chloroherpetonaceae bacterium]|nr:hypothetical protein [Chloroherpetonaceae bacterium]
PLVEIERQSSVFTVPTQRLWTVTITPPQTPIVVSLAHLPLTYKSTGDRLQYRLLAPGDSFRLDLAGMQFISGTNSGMSPDTLIDITILEYNITTVSDNDLNIPSLRGFPIAT